MSLIQLENSNKVPPFPLSAIAPMFLLQTLRDTFSVEVLLTGEINSLVFK